MTFWLLVWAASMVAALVTGMTLSETIARRMWRDDGYCPTCDRLTCAMEHDA